MLFFNLKHYYICYCINSTRLGLSPGNIIWIQTRAQQKLAIQCQQGNISGFGGIIESISHSCFCFVLIIPSLRAVQKLGACWNWHAGSSLSNPDLANYFSATVTMLNDTVFEGLYCKSSSIQQIFTEHLLCAKHGK